MYLNIAYRWLHCLDAYLCVKFIHGLLFVGKLCYIVIIMGAGNYGYSHWFRSLFRVELYDSKFYEVLADSKKIMADDKLGTAYQTEWPH